MLLAPFADGFRAKKVAAAIRAAIATMERMRFRFIPTTRVG